MTVPAHPAVTPTPPRALAAFEALYRQFVRPGDLIFDIGANIGENTVLFERLGARVVAVEPVRAAADTIPRSERVEVLRRAVGARRGTLELMVCTHALDISTASAEWRDRLSEAGLVRGHWDAREEVEMCTLDDLIAEYGTPAFVKIDVEGYEPEVVRGLSTPVAALSLETHAVLADRTRECIARLDGLGMRELALSEGHSAVLSEWMDAAAAAREVERLRWGDLYARG